MVSCHHHICLGSKHFYYPKGNHVLIKQLFPLLASLQPLAATSLHSVSMDLPISIFNINRII